MATQPDDEPLELTEELEVEEPAEEQEQEQPEEPQSEPDGEGEEEETIVSFGDDDPDTAQPDDSTVMRELRARNRELNTRVRELEKPQQPKTIEVGDKPTLESCDYDEEKFEAELDGWKERKRQVEAQAEQQEQQAKAANESWEVAKQRYVAKQQEHAFVDFQDAQDRVDEALGVISPVILKAANDPALIVYALGKNPAKLAELAKIKDPFELAAAVARMEGGVKVVKKRKGPVIDKPQSGSGSLIPTDPDKELEKLEKEAERTGDRTKVQRYKRQLRAKEKA